MNCLLKTLIVSLTLLNPSFEDGPLPLGSWNRGPVPGWNCTGIYGLWQPSKQYFSNLPAGPTVLWINQGSCSQDTGIIPQPNTDYVVRLSPGHRLDNLGTAFHVSLSDSRGDPSGTFCVMAGNNSFIPAGTFQQLQFRCPMGDTPPPQDHLWLTIASDGAQLDVDAISVTAESP